MNNSQIDRYLVTSVLLPNTRKKTASRECDTLSEVKEFVQDESIKFKCNHFIIDTNSGVAFHGMEKFLAPLDLAVEYRDIPLQRYLDNVLYSARNSVKETLEKEKNLLIASGVIAGGSFLGSIVASEASNLMTEMGEEAVAHFFGEAANFLFHVANYTTTLTIPIGIVPKLILNVGIAVHKRIKSNREFLQMQERLNKIPFRRFLAYRDHDFRSDELYDIGLAKAA